MAVFLQAIQLRGKTENKEKQVINILCTLPYKSWILIALKKVQEADRY